MKLEAITAKVRPRLGWEALDLGFRMVHQHWKALYGIWFGLTLPLFLLASLVFNDHLFWVLLIFWWLRPMFESALLNYISRALFGEFPTLKSSLNTFHHYAFRQWFSNHLWRRFSPTRSMDMAVSQLEGLSGAARTRRIRTLHAFNSGAASWLTLIFVLLHLLFYFNLVVLAMWMIPEVYLDLVIDVGWDFIWSDSAGVLQSFQALVIYLIISFFSPFYVVGGFAIYINQRTILEAWDIELVFKKLASRVSEKSHKKHLRRIASQLGFIALTVTLSFSSPDSHAEQDELSVSEQHITEQTEPDANSPLTHQSAQEKIRKILKQPPFYREQQKEQIYYDFDWDFNWGDDTETESNYDGSWSLGTLFGGLAGLVEVLLWGLVIFLAVWLLFKLSGLRGSFNFTAQKKPPTKLPRVMFGLEMAPETLPEHPDKHCWQLWCTGQQRQALSLLLRATLTRLMTDHQLQFEDGYTELECANIVRVKTSSSIANYFEQLIRIWRLFAYGHQIPQSEQVKHLCEEWTVVFNPARYEVTPNGVQSS